MRKNKNKKSTKNDQVDEEVVKVMNELVDAVVLENSKPELTVKPEPEPETPDESKEEDSNLDEVVYAERMVLSRSDSFTKELCRKLVKGRNRSNRFLKMCNNLTLHKMSSMSSDFMSILVDHFSEQSDSTRHTLLAGLSVHLQLTDHVLEQVLGKQNLLSESDHSVEKLLSSLNEEEVGKLSEWVSSVESLNDLTQENVNSLRNNVEKKTTM